MVRARAGRERRRAAAAVELALVLPLLSFLVVVSVDFGRLFYFSLTLQNCARNGAIYGCDPTGAAQSSPYKSIQDAALADASHMSPAPTITSQTVADANGSHIEVTVSWQFQTITRYPGIPSTVNLTRVVHMRMIPAVPNF